MTEKPANRLIREKSPYLLQHAHNPVDWHPWGEEAFAAAKAKDKPILLSIGYSTCHWCHVMERESFEDPGIAAVMNEYLVCIKVDREERPDVDKIYMTAVQAMTGAGGWPLNVFLTPDGDPIIGGTYFPPSDRGGRPGWPSLVRRIGAAWRDPEKRPQMIGAGRDLMENLARHLAAAPEGGAVGTEALGGVVEAFRADHDLENGGFGRSPKFPMPVYQHLLFRFYDWARRVPGRGAEAAEALGMALNALRAMSKGGIYDHLGGGFSRYSTDERWHLPHFEKMLYDNAQLALNLLDAFSITGEAAFAATAKETLDYVLRDMAHPEGGFFSAEDADSLPSQTAKEKTEGAFYVWEKEEIEKVLGEDAGLFISYYDVKTAGNVEEDPHGEFPEKNVLHVVRPLEEVAAHARLTPAEAKRRLASARATLFAVRARRPRPHLDDKVLVSWNGLMISALARAAVVLDDKRYLESASKCASFLQERLWQGPKGPLLRRWRDGEARIPAMADDLAFLTQGLLELFQAGGDPRWLSWAEALGDILLQDFYDGDHGGFSMTPAVHDGRVRFRPREDTDNVEPSAASVAVSAFLALSRLTDREDFRHAAEKTLAAHGPDMAEHPRQFPYMLSGLISFLSPPAEIVVAGPPEDSAARLLLTAARTRFMPGALVLRLDDGPAGRALAARLPALAAMKPVDGRPAAYVCTNFACRPPITDARALAELLDK